jgi:hypothetical protein
VKVADVVVSYDALDSSTLSLPGADGALFEVAPAGGVGDFSAELFLKAGAILDFETNPELEVTVEVDDPTVGGTPDGTAELTISFTDVNEPPAVALESAVSALGENTDTSSRMKVADIVVSDDALGTSTLSLAGLDASSFEIDGFTLYLHFLKNTSFTRLAGPAIGSAGGFFGAAASGG